MTTLIVLMPPRDPVAPPAEWQLPELPFLLLDKRGRAMRAGRSTVPLLPRASSTVLLLAARDILMISAKVPPLKGPRLRQVLPNLIEDQLIQDAQTCHIALDPLPLPDGRRMVAVVDRGWFRFLHESFSQAGHRALHAVPLTRCLPPPSAAGLGASLDSNGSAATIINADLLAAETAAAGAALDAPMVALVVGSVAAPVDMLPGAVASDAAPRLELALARGAFGEGLAVPADALASLLGTLAPLSGMTLLRLTDVPGNEPELRAVQRYAMTADPLSFESLARNALESKFDLCQFEFSAQAMKFGRDSLRRWRLPVALAAASLLVALVGENTEWLRLSRQRDAVNAQMTELLLTAFPKTTVVLDPADQMTRSLEQLRIAAGELSPTDFLTLSDGVARSLGPLPSNSIAALDYREHALVITFKPDAKVNDGFAQRLARNGLDGRLDQDKWIVRSAR